MTIKQSLDRAGKKITPLEAEVLLAHLKKVDRAWLYRNQNFRLLNTDYSQYHKLVKCRLSGKPLPYITNHKEFFGLDFYVDENVFIPRPETEILVEEVLGEVRSKKAEALKIVDVGTGSGCIAVALATNLKFKIPNLKIYATEVSKKALKIAKINAQKHKVLDKITFLLGDLLKPLPEKIDIIVANLPYVKTGYLKNLNFEPKIALDGGKDGFYFYKKLLLQGSQYLRENGKIFLEISPEQKEKIKDLTLKLYPLAKIQFKKDLANLDRVTFLFLHLAQSKFNL